MSISATPSTLSLANRFLEEYAAKHNVAGEILKDVPDAVFEVRSKSDRWVTVFARVVDWLDAGARIGILLDEPSGSASVYRSDELPQIFHNGDELVIPDVLPGFAVPVRRFFE